jgi:hypothetical protein
MTLRATGAMPNFRATGDDNRAIACAFEGDGAVDCTRKETRIRCASGVGFGGAATSGRGGDACCCEPGGSGGLAEGGAAALFDDHCVDDDGRGSDGEKSGELLKAMFWSVFSEQERGGAYVYLHIRENELLGTEEMEFLHARLYSFQDSSVHMYISIDQAFSFAGMSKTESSYSR